MINRLWDTIWLHAQWQSFDEPAFHPGEEILLAYLWLKLPRLWCYSTLQIKYYADFIFINVFNILGRFCETFNMHQKVFFFCELFISWEWQGRSRLNGTPSYKLAFEEKFLEVTIISSTKNCFWQHFQTPRRELKIRHVAHYFSQTLRCLEMWSIKQNATPLFQVLQTQFPQKNGCISFRSKSLHLYVFLSHACWCKKWGILEV